MTAWPEPMALRSQPPPILTTRQSLLALFYLYQFDLCFILGLCRIISYNLENKFFIYVSLKRRMSSSVYLTKNPTKEA